MEDYDEVVASLIGLWFHTKNLVKLYLDLKKSKSPLVKPSILEPPKIELKPLSPHLKCVFLGEYETLPIFISSVLYFSKVDGLKLLVKKSILAIGWTIANIIGIAPEIRSHKINLEKIHISSVEHQSE